MLATENKFQYWNLYMIGYWVIGGSRTYPQSSEFFKRFLKIIALVYIYQLAKCGDLMSFGSKDIQKCALSHVLILTMTSQKSWNG